jgi:hemolysin III
MDADARPRLRGVFHQYAFVAAVAAGIALVAAADGTAARISAWIYAAALAAMFGASALYHRVTWRSPRVRGWMRRLDHSAIFLLIAGTYTPFAVLAFEGVLADVILVVVWAGAAAGLVLNLVWIHAPKWLAALVYVALGWVGIVTLPQLVEHAGVPATALVLAGGALYTAGAVVYALRRPNPAPAVFGYHELFHVLVIAAALAQFAGVAWVVL